MGSFYITFTQLLRKIGVAIGPNEIAPVKEKCDELEEEIRKVARAEAIKVSSEHVDKVKEILNNYTKEITESLRPAKKEKKSDKSE